MPACNAASTMQPNENEMYPNLQITRKKSSMTLDHTRAEYLKFAPWPFLGSKSLFPLADVIMFTMSMLR